ncbi:MAG: HTH-type transcriptional regulator / antitoxin HipB [Actinoplanes sp.]|jgi:hypothetical protein|nr:HTH-type transcriptional regulator / antitoxin HipB [Actinoplanes sp.]
MAVKDPLHRIAEQVADCFADSGYAFIEQDKTDGLAVMLNSFLTVAGIPVNPPKDSRRWLSDLEAGKTTAEFGLILRTLDALGLGLDAFSVEPAPGELDLDALLGETGSERG